MTAPKCPYCKVTLEKMPTRKTKCKTCGRYIYVKCTPLNRNKRLMTEEQAAEAERLWGESYQRSRLADDMQSLGLRSTADVATARAAIAGLALDGTADSHRRKMAAHLLSTTQYAPDGEARVRWAMQAATRELEGLRRAGECAEILVGQEPCPSCARLRGRIWKIDDALRSMPLPNQQCERFQRGGACCAYWTQPKPW